MALNILAPDYREAYAELGNALTAEKRARTRRDKISNTLSCEDPKFAKAWADWRAADQRKIDALQALADVVREQEQA